MTLTLILGLVATAVALALAGKRVLFLFRLITSGQPAPDRTQNVMQNVGATLKRQLVEVLGQRKLLQWSIPGAAHFFVFWAFLILASVYLEAYGALFDEGFHIPVIGHWAVLGFAQDFIAVMAFVGIATFTWIRVKSSPARLGRRSRFSGSHLSGAWITLFMIFNVIWTMFLFRGAAVQTDNFPYGNAAFASTLTGKLLGALGDDSSEVLEHIGLLLHIGVMLVFLVFVVNSKHLHIFVAPLNVMFGRRPVALGAVKPMTSGGVPVKLDDIEDMDEDTVLGNGSIEDFSWKGLLDMATCTECGRCQDQCPAWNTEKPLSPKMLMLNLRDHAYAKAPYLLADEDARGSLPEDVRAEAARPLIGDEAAYGVIDPDVLWSCVTCGACVQQCPVDIEHVDHIVDMRRYQVLVESNFPAELNGLFKGLENKGNPWNMSPTARLDWAKGLDFEVKVVGDTIESLDEVEWLFWVGCAGAYEDRAKKTTRAVAELLDTAGVSFGVLGNGETCTGDSARRAGNEFVFQGLAQQNVETLTEAKAKKVVSTCAHCFNTLKNEYSEFGIELEVVHHTQLLNRLVREGKLTPVKDGEGAHKRSITYHDPCYIGRHNGVYSPPRELLEILPGAEFVEMERNSERSFCCGAGGARMWMEETIGSRINNTRTAEAVGTGADQIAVGCPFCRVMLSDGLTEQQANGDAREEVEVLDVAQMLLASVKGQVATKAKPGGAAPAAKAAPSEEVRSEPSAGDETQSADTVTATEDVGPAAKASGGTSLFDDAPAEPETATEEKSVPEEAAAAKPAASGGSLFDLGDDDAEATAPEPEQRADTTPEGAAPEQAAPDAAPATSADPADDLGAGGSLFDLGGDEPAAKQESAKPAAEPEAEPAAAAPEKAAPAPEAPAEEQAQAPAEASAATPEADLGSGGSLFDLAAPEPAATPTQPEKPAEKPASKTPAKAAAPEPTGGSLFDIAAPEAGSPAAETETEPEPDAKATPEAEEAKAEPEAAPEDEAPDLTPAQAGSAAATSAADGASDSPDTEAGDAETEAPEPHEAPEPESTQAPEPEKPPASGEAHQPKTDVDFDETGSLFDL